MGSWLCVTSLWVGVGYDHVWRAGGGVELPLIWCVGGMAWKYSSGGWWEEEWKQVLLVFFNTSNIKNLS